MSDQATSQAWIVFFFFSSYSPIVITHPPLPPITQQNQRQKTTLTTLKKHHTINHEAKRPGIEHTSLAPATGEAVVWGFFFLFSFPFGLFSFFSLPLPLLDPTDTEEGNSYEHEHPVRICGGMRR